MDATPEEWHPVVGFESTYQVSNWGNVRSIDRIVVGKNGTLQRRYGRLRKPQVTKDGYLAVNLRGPKEFNLMKPIHTLVLEAFVGPRPEGMQCCHNNGVRDDNRIENLRWDTALENMRDIVRHGHKPGMPPLLTHCRRAGHEYTPENTYERRPGWRECRTCRSEQSRRRRMRKCGDS